MALFTLSVLMVVALTLAAVATVVSDDDRQKIRSRKN